MNAVAVALLVPFVVIKLVGVLLGLVVVPLALMTQRLSMFGVDHSHWPDMFWLWGNDEEHYPEWWAERKHPWYIKLWPRFWWYAIRNPFNNFRFLFDDVEPDDLLVWGWGPREMEAQNLIDHKLKSAYRFVRHGWKCGYRRVWLKGPDRYSEFWLGWKLGSKVPGLGFAMQLRLNRSVGQ